MLPGSPTTPLRSGPSSSDYWPFSVVASRVYAGPGRPGVLRPRHERVDRFQFVIRHKGPPALIACCRCPSYRFGGSKETGFGNALLIIVNGLVTILFNRRLPDIDAPLCCQQLGRLGAEGAPNNPGQFFSPRLWKSCLGGLTRTEVRSP